ncbi:hypothetical protein SKAU_G00410850 [Synaphobranchus kaupii]|uniref:Uncharacterized protein n=1 Tax=Synaphobranchus kaupii TaxID=118154 RepID=A0A9Q1IBR0_SYNKA|nr:hypothetical protein SKAU_G00410850 [Synaphobranchus kaupii]
MDLQKAATLYTILLIQNAGSLESLQDLILQNSTMFQTAGCFRRVNAVEEKHTIVEEYLRLKQQEEGKTLDFWADYLLDCEEQPTAAVSLEDVFATGLSSLPPAGK